MLSLMRSLAICEDSLTWFLLPIHRVRMPTCSSSSAVISGYNPSVSGRSPKVCQNGRITSRARSYSPLSFSSKATSHLSRALSLRVRSEESSFANVARIGHKPFEWVGRKKFDCDRDSSAQRHFLARNLSFCFSSADVENLAIPNWRSDHETTCNGGSFGSCP